ncbi:MAG: O-antigen ligase family protein [Asticcacaulis sp.]
MTDRDVRPAQSLWQKFRAGYLTWFFLFTLTCFALWAYVTATGLPSLIFLMGLACIGSLRDWKRFAPFTVLTGVLLLMAVLRSDFADMLRAGASLAEASAKSHFYFVAPICLWVTCWAVIFTARGLDDARALRVFQWFVVVMMVLCAIQFIEAISQFGIRRALSAAYFHSRDRMLIVGMANTNTVLLMMVWPLTLYSVMRGLWLPALIIALVVVAAAVTSDNNAQLLGLAASAIVFVCAKYWPKRWLRKGFAPERVAAILAFVGIVGFPALIWQVMRNGMAERLKTDILPSWAARIDIWSFAVERSLEKPFWGWGYEASRQFDPIIPNHPHNMSLQAWLELGIPGLLLVGGIWLCLFWVMGAQADDGPEEIRPGTDLRALDDAPAPFVETGLGARFRPYLMAQATAYLIICMISYGLWRAWFYVLGAFAVMTAILAMKAATETLRLRN